MTWKEAAQHTERALADPRITGDPGSHRYVNLTSPESAGIPLHRLDDLLAQEWADRSTILLKCDVEGAEYEVLSGAIGLMRNVRMPILLSVHPDKLKYMGKCVKAVEDLLASCGYGYREIAVDHERHWLCESIS